MGILNTTPRTWVTSEVVTAAELNAEIRDPLTAVQAAWTAYVPTTTGLTLTSGTLTGRYNRVGKTVDFFCQFTFGASSAVTGSVTFTLPPVTALNANWKAPGSAFDTSASNNYDLSGIATSTTSIVIGCPPAVAGNALAPTSATVPFTWATGDILTVQGRYEAA